MANAVNEFRKAVNTVCEKAKIMALKFMYSEDL